MVVEALPVTLDESAHEYRVSLHGEARRVPSVTTILRAAGVSGWSRFPNPGPREYGRRVHLLTARLDRGERVDVPMMLEAPIAGWRRWVAMTRPTFTHVEWPFGCRVDGRCYAGTIDRVAVIGGVVTVVELKAGSPSVGHARQLAAYALRVNARRAIAVYLRPDGKIRVVEFTPVQILESQGVFLTALANWIDDTDAIWDDGEGWD